jgi:hypothetical protein
MRVTLKCLVFVLIWLIGMIGWSFDWGTMSIIIPDGMKMKVALLTSFVLSCIITGYVSGRDESYEEDEESEDD